jgi:hypothetical protein
MTPFLGLLIILLITFVGARFLHRSTITKNPLFSGLIVSGFPYILIGLVLGPQLFNFLNAQIIRSLEPLIALAIGWVGLLFGLQLRWRNIRRFPRNYVLFTSVQSLVTFLVILAAIGIGFLFIRHSLYENQLEAVIILAALGSMTAPLTIARIAIERKIKGRLTHLLQFISSLDSFWGITIAGIAMAIFDPIKYQWINNGWIWLGICTLISIVLGLLFRYLIRLRFQQDEIFVLVLGLVIFTSGIGFYLKLSPIFMNFIVGATLSQFPRESEKVMRVIHPAEKPTYLFLLVFAGALWNYRFWGEIILIIIFILARFFGKYLGGWLSARKIDCAFEIPPNIGKALLSFGGISLAIAFNFQLFHGGPISDFLMSTTILGILIFDEYTAVSTLNILRKQGEAG